MKCSTAIGGSTDGLSAAEAIKFSAIADPYQLGVV
jgi:hypothetical protein